MLTTIKGFYAHGQIILQEMPPVTEKTDVLITFLTEGNQPGSGKTEQSSAKQDQASEPSVPKKSDDTGYVVMESGLGIDE